MSLPPSKSVRAPRLLKALIEALIRDADEAMGRGPYSVTDKATLPPSGDCHDYWHPAPYWWPNPETADGLPYIWRDGHRVPGTRMYEPESKNYDRTRLQRMFDDSTILALAWKFTGKEAYARKAVALLECFFIDPSTRMNPHLMYAQVRMGHNSNVGSASGIIEMKDLYYYLDAVRLLIAASVLRTDTLLELRAWLSMYLQWLLESPQGKRECSSGNNHGTYYDLQVASICAFLGKHAVLYETLIRAQNRIPQQFAEDGSQQLELSRTNTAHYCCFNLQGWVHLGEIASRYGVGLWQYETPKGIGLARGAQWLLSHLGKDWPFEQHESFDVERFYPLWCFASSQVSPELLPRVDPDIPDILYRLKPKFWPHDGIRPYWNLGSRFQRFPVVHRADLGI